MPLYMTVIHKINWQCAMMNANVRRWSLRKILDKRLQLVDLQSELNYAVNQWQAWKWN